MALPQSQSPSVPSPSPITRGSSLSADVVCGSDFTEFSAQAVQAAAALAERLILVHVVDERLQREVPDRIREPILQAAGDRLRDAEEALRGCHGTTIRTDVRIGRPAAMLQQEAETHEARLIVVGAPRQDAKRAWSEMSIAEEVAETARIPTLIVRHAAPILEWLQGARRLRVFVAADFSAPSESALHWAEELRGKGPCEIFAAFLGRNSAQIETNETVPSLFLDEMVSKAAHTPERLFEARVRTQLGLSHVHMRFGKSSGRSAESLIQLALQERADLMIVGTHSRQGWHRIGHPSVSRFVLRHAPLNVLVCPEEVNLQ